MQPTAYLAFKTKVVHQVVLGPGPMSEGEVHANQVRVLYSHGEDTSPIRESKSGVFYKNVVYCLKFRF